MRVAVVDIGTNSTRLLVADLEDGKVVRQLDKRSEVTRLGEGVDATGRLGDEPMQRVFRVLDDYRREADELGAETRIGVLTSAVRDADNGAEFTQAVRERFGFDARTIDGDTEAELTFAGATSERDPADTTPLVVVDIGGGSTEVVQGAGGTMEFHVSTQAGVVRQTERHIHTDPPRPAELETLATEVRGIVLDNVPDDVLDAVSAGIGVAGTATSCAAIDQELDPYDPDKVHGYVLERTELDGAARAIGRPAARAAARGAPACTPTARRPSWPAWSSSSRCSTPSRWTASRSPNTTSSRAPRHGFLNTPEISLETWPGRMFDCCRAKARGILPPPGEEGRAPHVPRIPAHRFGRSRIESAPPAARTAEPGPFMARTPARPDGATWEAAA